MARLLVVHHTPSPATQALLEAALEGCRDPDIAGVEVVVRPALVCGAVEVMEADGYLLGTPANIGYLSGALKHFFDQVYYPCLLETRGRPFGAWIHGNDDTTGAVRGLTSITTGLQWRPIRPAIEITGAVDRPVLDACRDLGATLAATLAGMV